MAMAGNIIASFKSTFTSPTDDAAKKIAAKLMDSLNFLFSYELFFATCWTMLVYMSMLIAAFLVSVIIGFIIYRVKLLAKVLEPFISIMRPIPAIAMIAVGSLILGGGSKYLPFFVAFLGALWPLTAAVVEGLKTLPKSYIESGITLGKTNSEINRQVILPASWPLLFNALNIGAPIALLLVITVEYLYPSDSWTGGIGSLLLQKHTSFQYPIVVTIVLWLSLLSIGVETILEMIERNICKWNEPDEVSSHE